MCVCLTRGISLLVSLLWTLAPPGSAGGQRDGTVPRLSKEDVLLLAEDGLPKCFARTHYDFTCFWEETSNKSFDFFYRIDDSESRCALSVQRTDEGSQLHVCSFPASHVFMFTDIHVRVTDRGSNTTVYSRSVSVEDQGLLDPPGNVTLHHTGRVGQLRVAWTTPTNNLDWVNANGVNYEIRHSSPSRRDRTEPIAPVKTIEDHTLTSLTPGEVTLVQIRVRPQGYTQNENSGHWSDWSAPVYATVPQSADNISLFCYTSDLHNVTCQWNEMGGTSYTLFYKMNSRGGEERWRECLQDGRITSSCRFRGSESRVLRVKLSAGPGVLSPTFYTEPFGLSSSVRTAPPGRVRGESEGGRLDLRWDAPLLALSVHLMYQIQYQARLEDTWKRVTLQGPETRTSLDVQMGNWYQVQVRAKPNGSVYAGYWSDWSHSLTVAASSDIRAYLIICVPIMVLILGAVSISMFSRYLSKLKQYLWPPVPNLDKVLQGFLTEINGQTWDLPYNAKQCFQETPASVVEIMSEREAPGGGKSLGGSAPPPSPERGSALPPSPERGSAPPPSPERGSALPASPERGSAPPPSPERGSAPPPSPERGSALPPSPERGSAPPPSPERGSALPASPERGSAPPPSPERGSALPPSPERGSALPPSPERGSAPPPSPERGSAPPPSPERGSAPPPSPERGSASARQRAEPSPEVNVEVGAGYVTLNTDIVTPGLQGNEDDEEVKSGSPREEEEEEEEEEEVAQLRYHRSSFPPSDILNHSYLLLEETSDTQGCQGAMATGSRYANLDEGAPLAN